MYDVIILGGGFAGLTSAIYTTRAGLKTLVLEKEPACGGQIALSAVVENWPTEKSISGLDLSLKLTEQVKNLGAEIKTFEEVQSVVLEQKIKKIKTSVSSYESKAVIIATGAHEKKLGILGESEFKGKGVSYCALCDAAFFKDKIVGVIGGGNTAFEESEFISKFASKIYIIHRREEFRAEKILVQRAEKNPKIEFLLNKIPVEIIGDKFIEKIKLKDAKTGEISEIKLDGVFVFIGMIPNTSLFSSIKKDEKGYLLADENMQTNLSGVFVAGDVRKKPIEQLVTASSDGAIAGVSAFKYLTEGL
jgi:thioredoxin reductase (NADPH)